MYLTTTKTLFEQKIVFCVVVVSFYINANYLEILRLFIYSELSEECIDYSMMFFFSVMTFLGSRTAPIFRYNISKDK